MKNFEIELCGVTRTLPFVDIGEDLAYASFVIISDIELISHCAPALAEKLKGTEMIVTAEAKGIALAYEVSRLLDLKEFVVARKSIKSYMKNPISIAVKSITTTLPQKLYLDSSKIEKIRDKKICVLDDVVSTGDSLSALENLVSQAGGKIIYKACLLAEGKASERNDLIYLQKLPLFRKLPNGEYEVIA